MENPVLSTPDYNESVYPREKTYFRMSLIFSILLWLLIVVGTIGIGLFYVVFFAIFLTIGHAIFLSYIRGYGIKVTEKQFGEIYALAENASTKLGLKEVPDIYIYNMDGIFNAFATHFFARNFVIVTTAILDACDNDLKKIEFIVAHELVHIQRGHTRRQFFLFPSKIIPWLGNAYSRACEYTCDGVAGKFILNNKEQAVQGVLLLPTADATRASHIDIEAYDEQRKQSGGFWMTLVETGSTHPFSFNRVTFIRSLFGDKIEKVSKSFFGMLLSPFFSIGGGNLVQIFVVIAIIGIFAAALFPALSGYLERGREAAKSADLRQQQIEQQMRDLDSYTK